PAAAGTSPRKAQSASRTTAWAARAALLGVAIALAGLAASCYVFAYRPAVEMHRAISRAAELATIDPQSPAIRLLWLDAAQADPWSGEPYAMLAELEVSRVRRNPEDQTARQRFSNAIQQLNLNRMHSASVSRQIGEWLDELDEIERNKDLA